MHDESIMSSMFASYYVLVGGRNDRPTESQIVTFSDLESFSIRREVDLESFSINEMVCCTSFNEYLSDSLPATPTRVNCAYRLYDFKCNRSDCQLDAIRGILRAAQSPTELANP